MLFYMLCHVVPCILSYMLSDSVCCILVYMQWLVSGISTAVHDSAHELNITNQLPHLPQQAGNICFAYTAGLGSSKGQ